MKKYESVKIELLCLWADDIITSSVDGEPIPADKNEGIWGDFY